MTPVRKMLDLSTKHMPETNPDFMNVRVFETGFGYVVFVSDEPAEDGPAWLAPVWEYAQNADCLIINFDSDAETYPDLFPSWDW